MIVVIKLILNSIFGYSVVNSDRHSEIQMLDVTEEDDNLEIKKAISKNSFKSLIAVDKKVLINKAKATYTLEYPLMIGSAILWESKILTANFVYGVYDYIEKLSVGSPHPMELHITFMDTDSVVYSIRNFYRHFQHQSEFSVRFNNEVYPVFDTSFNLAGWQQPETHEELKFLKDEFKGVELLEVNALCAKCYSCLLANDKEVLKAKGISKRLAKRLLDHTLYGKVIDGSILEATGYVDAAAELRDKYMVTFGMIKSGKFTIENIDFCKQYLTLVDLKAYYPENSGAYQVYGSVEHLETLQK
jgi:hypothetical protein